jgi:hypothetical protein
MNESAKREERDAILIAIHQECEKPTTEQIIAWIEQYPDYAEDIRAHAAVSLDWAARETGAEGEVSQSLLDRGFSNALNAFYSAQQRAQTEANVKSFQDLAAALNIDVVQMAREMDIARGVLAALFNGLMLPPIRRRLIEHVCRLLAITREVFDSALALATLRRNNSGQSNDSRTTTILAGRGLILGRLDRHTAQGARLPREGFESDER